MPGLTVPSYHRYYASPVKIVEAADGGVQVWRVSADTGGWRQRNDLLEEIVFAVGGDVFVLPPDRFVQEVEAYRGRHLSGDGPIFALYEVVKAILETAVREDRRLTQTERELIRGIRSKTFVMFEEWLQRQGDPGADPTVAAP